MSLIRSRAGNPQLNGPQPGSAANRDYTFIGDYFGNTATASVNYSTFVDTYNVNTQWFPGRLSMLTEFQDHARPHIIAASHLKAHCKGVTVIQPPDLCLW